MKLSEIQPSQLYICSEKLSVVMKAFNVDNPNGNEVILVDGHIRAFAAFLCSFSEIPVYWECEELDWYAYKICVEWRKKEGIHTIAHLKIGL
ncbi:hypothetical protein KEJ37_02665 [Candidatus Bathyarchaeota archaeon]|nr:hypothetical protein [Candidatus Bathyarchaeota archaeon]